MVVQAVERDGHGDARRYGGVLCRRWQGVAVGGWFVSDFGVGRAVFQNFKLDVVDEYQRAIWQLRPCGAAIVEREDHLHIVVVDGGCRSDVAVHDVVVWIQRGDGIA